ncbi:MAG TPA: hypothetical protein ACFCUY_17260 [Xenococcaceae cyanobacterium]
MNHHYILNINPQAEQEWERCILRHPLTGKHPDLAQAIAESVGKKPGSHLVKVKIEVEILETEPHLSESLANGSFRGVAKLANAAELITN